MLNLYIVKNIALDEPIPHVLLGVILFVIIKVTQVSHHRIDRDPFQRHPSWMIGQRE